MAKPERVYLYRITHIDNLDYILGIGKLTCPSNSDCDPNYIGIGDSTLIGSRNSKQIKIKPNGNFTDYVAFYFGMRSPMLYSIQKGYNGVTKRNAETIVYLITTFENVKSSESQYVFADGHGYHAMSQFFNNEDDLKEVDWNIVNLKRWNDTEADPDRKRRKQAEFLVYDELLLSSLIAVVVYNEEAKDKILAKFAEHDFSCNVIVKPNWYY